MGILLLNYDKRSALRMDVHEDRWFEMRAGEKRRAMGTKCCL
jgi:hypothetical protein